MPPLRDDPRGNPIEGPGDYTTTENVHSDTYDAIDPVKANLAGRAVFISGGSRGIGRAAVLSFAKAGASYIAVGARQSPALSSLKDEVCSTAKKAGKEEPTFLALPLDVTDADTINAAAAQLEAAFGRLDIVVNNAGILGPRGKAGDTDPDAWWNTFVVNLRGPYLITRAFLPLMLKTNGLKTFVTVSSVGAVVVLPTLSAYQPSKLAVLRFAEFVAKEYADDGIISITIHPGNIVTEILGPDGPAEAIKHIFTETPEISADTIVFLTKERQEWLSGRYVNVTWDMPQLFARRDDIVRGDKLKVKLDLP